MPHPTQYRSFRRRSSQPITWLILTNKTVHENTDKQTHYHRAPASNTPLTDWHTPHSKLAWSVECVQSYILHTHTRLTAPFPGLPRWAGTRKVKPIRILLKQETMSGSGISWAICKSAPRSRPITTPTPHHSVFYRPDALPATEPTASKHWRQKSYVSELRIK